MTRTLRYLLLFVFTGLSGSTFAQEIAGRVLDDKNEPLINGTVQVYQGGILKGGAVTDYDGNYTVKPLDAGYYNVLVLYAGYDSIMVTGVVVSAGDRTTQNFNMTRRSVEVKGNFVIKAYKKPLVDIDKPASHILTKDEIAVVPTTETTDLVALAPSLYQGQRGKGINAGGARKSGMLYIVDGVQVQNIGAESNTGLNMSQGSVEQLEVISSGIPANYGDVSGAVVNITSRGVSQKLTGDVRLQHSIDGYNNNLASFSMAGPLYKKRIDSVTKKPVLGFALSGDYYDDHDRYPTYNEQYSVKPEKLRQLQKSPLFITSDNTGLPVYQYASNYITYNDLYQTKITPHNETKEIRLNGKLDYQVTDNMRIAAGGSVDYTNFDLYSRGQDLFAPENMPVEHDLTSRGYIRFTQKFGKAGDTSSRHSIISNAYYAVQGDYQRTSQLREDPKFKDNFFDYAYVGKFTQTRSNFYSQPNAGTSALDSASGKTGFVLQGNQSTGIYYDPHTPNSNGTVILNPGLSNYTSQYYNSLNANQLPTQYSQIQGYALGNGQEPAYTYGLFVSPGTTQYYYSNFVSNQYALSVDASFDLLLGKTKHAIEFGLYYQQRIQRSYTLETTIGGTGAQSLWSQMRQLVSSIDNGNLVLDKKHPFFVIGGQRYAWSLDANKNVVYTDANGNKANILPGNTDTIVYNYINPASSAFDQNLRKKLGSAYTANGGTKDINIDALDPSTFSMGMFSADEILNSGHPYASYYGYTYTGGVQAQNVNFNDFWTQKDANGNYTRPIGAFSPNYIAGYLLDKFSYKDVHFNIGVRIDRYSANTKVLIDPFSEYPEVSVGQNSQAINPQTGTTKAPSNIGSNYVVYVNDNNSTAPVVIGYRNGNNWYDPTGKFVNDPSVLKQYSGGRDPQPYIPKGTPLITDTNFNPNASFTDYTPQVTLQPRLQFSFPISDVADFYAHYDIYAQRPYPSSLGIATAYDYYYLSQNSNSIISNANLKPQKTFDYEVGFQQKLSDHSALTITGFYKERKDMITVVPYVYAWPTTYYTYGNRDFSSTKGSTILYDLRATNHLRMNLSYTLQFAEGTGSDYNSSSGSTTQAGRGLLGTLVEAGLPYLRYVTAADFDSRHNIVANIDYRFNEGEGPIVSGLHILQNAGIDLIGRARSGEPFTRYSDPQGTTVIGGINGSRLPWHYGLDLRMDKDFALFFGKRHKDVIEGIKPKRPLFLKAILTINNLANTRDIIGVYGYTGRPDDNGYLTSSFGQTFVPQQINPKSYANLYQISVNDPAKLNYARTISFALEFNF